MANVLLSGPTVEPISLAEAKAYLRVDTNAEDTLLQSLIMASRLHIEAALDLALITQSWRIRRDTWPSSRTLILPLHPVQSVISVKVYGTDDSAVTLNAADMILDGHAKPARLIWRGNSTLPTSGLPATGVEIDIIAGFGDDPSDVPQPVRQALLLLVAHWYENREPVEIGAPAAAIPSAVSDLLSPYRRRKI